MGSGALAFFPAAAGEGGAVAALRAGASIVNAREALATTEPGLSVRVGMDHGQVLSGLFGGEDARVYSVVGAPVRTATRVTEIAQPGQLLCTGAVRDSLGDAAGFQIVALGPHALRGRPEPIALFLVTPGRARGEEGEP
jgi:class 3 adenylate cyclase